MTRHRRRLAEAHGQASLPIVPITEEDSLIYATVANRVNPDGLRAFTTHVLPCLDSDALDFGYMAIASFWPARDSHARHVQNAFVGLSDEDLAEMIK